MGTLQPEGRIARFLFSIVLIGISFTPALAQRSPQTVANTPSAYPHLSGRASVIGKTPALNGQKTVRFIYLVPSDVAVKPAYTQSIKNAARHLQQWYRDQLGGNKSFRMTDEVVEVHQSTHPSSWYATNPDADWAGEWKFWFNAVNDAFSLSGGRFEDPDNFWVIYVDALPVCPMQQGGGLNGVAAMGANDLRGLIGQPWIPICNEVIPNYSPCRYVGGLGHELGHAFGLAHPAGCDDGQPVACDYNALMYTGYVNYPSTYFSESEKATLRSSPFITTISGAGCDIDCSALTRDYAITSSQQITICQGDSYYAGGQMQTVAGTYTDRYLSKSGCDSILTTRLTVLPKFNSTRDVSICQGQSLFAGGKQQTTSGTYIDRLKSKAGCDSVVTTKLTVLSSFAISRDISICQGQSLFAGGKQQTTSGTYIDRLKSKAGCDSVVTTKLTVLSSFAINKDISICQGQSLFAGGKQQTTSGTYIDRLKSKAGCDSVVTTKLTVLSSFAINKDISICQGQSLFAGGKQQTTSGTYIDRLKSKAGCDSVITTKLTVLPSFAINKDISICQGQSLFAGGKQQTTSGTYIDRLKSKAGCDSVVTTKLTVLSSFAISRDISICQGQSLFAGGKQQTTSGTYIDKLKSKAGCDSVITTKLTVLPSFAINKDISICQGQSLFAGGKQQTTSGTYIDRLKSKAGCDSVVTTKLTVLSSFAISRDISICQGQSLFAGGKQQTTSGTYVDRLKSKAGCDSVVTTKLTVLSSFAINKDISICKGDTYLAGGVQRSVSGTYYDNLKTVHGCDSVVTTHLQVVNELEVTKDETICAGESYVIGSNTYSLSGTYRELFPSHAGCDSIVILHLTVLPQYENTVEINTCVGETYFAGGQLQTTSGIYTDIFKSVNGCDSVVTTKLTVGVCMAVELPKDLTLSIYPIPASRNLHIDAPYFDHAVLLSQAGRELILTSDRDINTESLADGIYYIRVYEDKKRFVVKKVLVLH
ncbi:MAG: hypothetical protein QM762_25565 [Chryseolinea sp.]